jgi:hypothetical protein
MLCRQSSRRTAKLCGKIATERFDVLIFDLHMPGWRADLPNFIIFIS